MKNFVLTINTISSCRDVWEMFFTQLDKYFPNQKVYVFTDEKEGLPNNVTPIIYNSNDSFRTQTLKCLQQVDEKYSLYLNEDYILYDDVLFDEIQYCLDYLEQNEEISFVRLIKGIEYNEPRVADKIYLMDNKNMYFFSQTATIWRTRDFERIHEHSPESGTAFKVAGPQLELVANDTCKDLDIRGVFYYNNDPKRGTHHYDSSVFPHIATAVIKGRWNLNEYFNELYPLLSEYNIDANIRGSNI